MEAEVAFCSGVRFRSSKSGKPVTALPDATITLASRDGPEWLGVHLEEVVNPSWHVEDVMYDGHFIGLNLGDDPLVFNFRVGRRWDEVRLPKNAFFIIPDQVPFSIHHSRNSRSLTATVDPDQLSLITGCYNQPAVDCAFHDDLLAHLLKALADRAKQSRACGTELTQAISRSFLLALQQRHGTDAHRPAATAFRQDDLREIIAWIDENLGASFTVDDVAKQTNLSTASFTRAFKRSVGTTPWAFVISRRLDAAAVLLGDCMTPAAVAEQCGFADQAHLTRLFKRKFGLSPGAFAGTRSKFSLQSRYS